jgi:ATP/maltotriose-dependent transcriptional regulator MalT
LGKKLYYISLSTTPGAARFLRTDEGNVILLVLTNREEQVLKLMADGLTNKNISSSLSISESTVENHIHHIYIKLRVSNRAQAVAHAFQLMLAQQDQMIGNRGNPS